MTALLQRISKVINLVIAGDPIARSEIINTTSWYQHVRAYGDTELISRFNAAWDKARLDTEYERSIDYIKQLYSAWQSATDEQSQLEAWAEFVYPLLTLSAANRQRIISELEYDQTQTLAHIQDYVTSSYDRLVSEALLSSTSFGQLKTLILRLRNNEDPFRRAGLAEVEIPDEWNMWVANHIENPPLGAFVRLDRPIEVGKVRLMAAAALRDQNLLQAKIVLAYCNSDPKILAEVGDYLSAEIAKLVKDIQRPYFRVARRLSSED